MKNKRLLIVGGVLIVLCLAAIKTGVVQMVYSNMQEAVTETTTTIQFCKEPYLNARASLRPDVRQLAFCTGTKEFFVQDVKTREITTYPARDKVYQVKFSPDGAYLAVGRDVLNLNTGQMLLLDTDAVIIPPEPYDYIAFSPDGETLAIVNKTNPPPGMARKPTVIEIWNLKTEKLVQRLPIGEVIDKLTTHATLIYEMAFSPDGRYLAVAGTIITLWDVQECKFIKPLVTEPTVEDKSLELFSTEYMSVAYSPDGKYLAAAIQINRARRDSKGTSEERVQIWDPEKGEIVKTIEDALMTSLSKVKYSPDGRYLAVGNNVGRTHKEIGDAVWIWDAAGGQLCTKLEGFPDYFTYAMDYSADGKYLSASGPYNLKIWQIK